MYFQVTRFCKAAFVFDCLKVAFQYLIIKKVIYIKYLYVGPNLLGCVLYQSATWINRAIAISLRLFGKATTLEVERGRFHRAHAYCMSFLLWPSWKYKRLFYLSLFLVTYWRKKQNRKQSALSDFKAFKFENQKALGFTLLQTLMPTVHSSLFLGCYCVATKRL